MESVLRRLTYDTCLIYLDDVIVMAARVKNNSITCGRCSRVYEKHT
jgi:hypothetical protein